MTKLKTCLFFNAVGAGATVSLAHGLNVNNVAVIPDQLEGTSDGFTVTADAVNVTVTNNLAVVASTYILTTSWHDIDRQFGTRENNPFATPNIYPVLWQSPSGTYPQEGLIPRPFAEAGGTGGSAPLIGIVNDAIYNAVTHVATLIHTTIGIPASGTITTIVPGLLADNDNFILNDGVNPATTFEFQVTGGFIPVPGRIPIDVTACANADDVRNAIVTAVNLVVATLAITAAGPLAATVNLVNDLGGVAGNVAIIDNVANPGFICVGMAGGTAGSAAGMGTGLLYRAENAAAAVVDAACIDAVSTSVVAGFENFDIVFSARLNGAALVEKGRLSSAGVWSSTSAVFTQNGIVSPIMLPGVSLVDNTVGIALRQYSSPTLFFQGSGWNTVTIAPCPVKFQNYVKAGSAAADVGVLAWAEMIGAEAVYTDRMRLSHDGVLDLLSPVSAQLNLLVAGVMRTQLSSSAADTSLWNTSGKISFWANGGLAWEILATHELVPGADVSHDLGTAGARVRCVYTGKDALLATLTPSVSLVNTTVAIAGAGNQQNSPSNYFQGSGWNTVTIAPCPIKFQNYIKASSGNSDVGMLAWAEMIGAEAVYTDVMRLGGNGTNINLDILAVGGTYALMNFYQAAVNKGYLGLYGGIFSVGTPGATVFEIQTNGTQRWQYTAVGHYVPFTDQVYDLGDATHRVRTLYAGSDAIGVGTTCGVSLVNKTASTAILQQCSPMLCFTGHAWDIAGAGSDVEVSMAWQLRPQAGITPVYESLELMRKQGGAAWGTAGFRARNDGAVWADQALFTQRLSGNNGTADTTLRIDGAGWGWANIIAGGHCVPQSDNASDFGTAALRFKDYYFMGMFDGESMATPAAPLDGIGRLYFHDNGVATPNRKTQLCMMCHDGTEILIAESAAY
jgi:hypothetical protein